MDDSYSPRLLLRDKPYFSPGISKSGNFRKSVSFASVPQARPTLASSICEHIEKQDADSVAELLLSEGENIDVNRVLPEQSISLLHLAVGLSENDPQIVELLLRCRGDPNNREGIEDGLSPLHISVQYDYDRVMRVLMEYGGDPTIPTGDGQTCYDIVKFNVENEMLENCFGYLFLRSKAFRKSIACPPGQYNYGRQMTGHDSGGSDGFYTCDSRSEIASETSQNEGLRSVAKRLFPSDYSYLMTEDDSAGSDSSSDCEEKRKLTTIPEESGIASTSPSHFIFSPVDSPMKGLNSITVPQYYITDDSISVDSDPSCINSTPPVTPQPSQEDLEKLQEQMKHLKIPITPLTYNVISKLTESEDCVQRLLQPKIGFSSELHAALENLNLINDWGNLKVDLLQSTTPTANLSKSYYNYLLLDPKVTMKANFSGNHLKTGVINSPEKFEKFLTSVFYIGKGHGKRPVQHMVDAKVKYVELGRKPLPAGEKINKILEIWKSGLGVHIVSVFHHSSERDAHLNEACMIDAIGLGELSNMIKGSYSRTLAESWSQKTKNQFGSFLLYKAFCTFAVGAGRPIKPEDV